MGALSSTAFDSSGGTAGAIASVGCNGAFAGTREIDLGGGLRASGGVTITEQLETSGTLRAGGALSARGAEVEVHGDAYVAGDVSSGVQIEGTLHVPDSATVDPAAQAKSVVREPVSVAPPCDCQGAQALDLAGEVQRVQAHHDDGLIGLGAGTLGAATLDLPCGAYYVEAVDAAGPLTLRVHGLAELVVGHDLVLQGGLAVALDGGAELDLVVGGAIRSSGAATLGSPASPPRVRLWAASDSTLVFDGNPSLHLILTAPRAAVSAAEGLTIEGAILARQFSAGTTLLRYDRAILSSGAACGTGPENPDE